MEKKSAIIIDIVIRSIVFVIINYFLLSAELSFKTSILGLLAAISNVWMIINYYESVQRQSGNKRVTILLCALCFIASTAIAYFAGYVHGTIISF